MINTNRMSHDPFVLRNYEPLATRHMPHATCHMPHDNIQQTTEVRDCGGKQKNKTIDTFRFLTNS
jgi:hypothetical protein